MKAFLKKWQNLIFIFLIISFSVLLLTYSENAHTRGERNIVETLVLRLISPFQLALTKTVKFGKEVWYGYIYLVAVQKENVHLREEIERFRMENNSLLEDREKLKRVMDLLGFKKERNEELLYADVIGKDATNWSKTLIISAGTEDGVQVNDPVITSKGVVGRVSEVSGVSSKVILITDGRSAVDSLTRRKRVGGVVLGGSEGKCVMKYIPISADIKPGDIVISSGLGGVFPKGLEIGRVLQVHKEEYGLFQVADVFPSAKLRKVEEVFVMISKKEVEG